MIRAILLSVSLFLAAGTRAFSADSTCHLYKYGSAPMHMSQWGIPTVPVKINGKEYHFLVSSSFGASVVRSSVVADLKLHETSNVGLWGHIGPAATMDSKVTVDTFDIGSAPAHHVDMFVVASEFLSNQVSGVLSLDSLQPADRPIDVELDFAGRKLNLFASQGCKEGEVVYWTKAPAAAWPFGKTPGRSSASFVAKPEGIEIKAQLDGHDLNASLDTMQPASVLGLQKAWQLLGRREINSQRKRISVPPSPWLIPHDYKSIVPKIYAYPFKSLTFAGVGISNPNILLADEDITHPSLIIGNSILSKFHLYIAYSQHVVYATAANAH